MSSGAPLAEVKVIKSRIEKRETLTQNIATALKDHKNEYVQGLLDRSNEHCAALAESRSLQLSDVACRLTLANPSMEKEVKIMFVALKDDGLNIKGNRDGFQSTLELPSLAPETNLGRAANTIQSVLSGSGHALYRGSIFSKHDKSKVTYLFLDTAEDFINKLLGVPRIGPKLIDHVGALVRILKHPSCSLVPQLQINFDIIEVLGNKCWQFSTRSFIDNPYSEEDAGRITPRMFFEYDPSGEPDAKYFRSSINNAFPDIGKRTRFLNKWLQLFLHQRMPHKIPKLLTYGAKDSGKSTWFEPIRGVVPHQFIATVTREGAFATSMVNSETQCTFVDEFDPTLMSAGRMKEFFQGGLFGQTRKFKDSYLLINNSPVYITCQEIPDFGVENANLYRRFSMFETRPLQHTVPGADLWMRENAIHCIVWASNVVNKYISYVEQTERWYEPGRMDVSQLITEIPVIHNKQAHYESLDLLETSGKRYKALFTGSAAASTATVEIVPESAPSEDATTSTIGDTSNPNKSDECVGISDCDSIPSVEIPVITCNPDSADIDFTAERVPAKENIPSTQLSQSPDLFCYSPAPTMLTPPRPFRYNVSHGPLISSLPGGSQIQQVHHSSTPVRLPSPLNETNSSESEDEDEDRKRSRAIMRLLQTNIDKEADKVGYFSHLARCSKMKRKPDNRFYAWCFVTGRFQGDFKPSTLYRYYSRQHVQGHVERIRLHCGVRKLKP